MLTTCFDCHIAFLAFFYNTYSSLDRTDSPPVYLPSGSSGDPVSIGCEDYLVNRRYPVRSGLLNVSGTNVVAVRVFSPGGDKPGGLCV